MLQIQLFDSENLNTYIEIPQTWNEFDLNELLALVHLLSGRKSSQEFILYILQYRIALLNEIMPANWLYKLNLDDAVTELLPIVQHYCNENNLTKNPLPIIGQYHGPADAFDNLLVGEFELADQYINLYVEHQNLEYIRLLAMQLWRPLNSAGARLSPRDFEPSNGAKSFFNALEEDKLQLIYLWWVGCRTHLIELFPLPFGNSDSTSANQDESIFTDVIHTSAGERNGTRSHIRWETLIKEFLYDVQLQLRYQADNKIE